MANTSLHLALLASDIAILREQLAELPRTTDTASDRVFLFRELVYCLVSYKALLRKYRAQHALQVTSHEGHVLN